MQQQSMAMAGINLNTLEPSTPSTVNVLESIIKSESPSPNATGGELRLALFAPCTTDFIFQSLAFLQ